METAFSLYHLLSFLGGMVIALLLALNYRRPNPILVGSRNDDYPHSSSSISGLIYLLLAAAIGYTFWIFLGNPNPSTMLPVPPVTPRPDTAIYRPIAPATIQMIPDSSSLAAPAPPLPQQSEVATPATPPVITPAEKYYQISAFKRVEGIEEELAKWQRLLPGKKVVVTRQADIEGWYRAYINCNDHEVELYHRRYELLTTPHPWTELAPLLSDPG